MRRARSPLAIPSIRLDLSQGPLGRPRALLGQVAGGRSQVEQLGKVRSDVRVIRLVDEQARGGAGLQISADLRLEGIDMGVVPVVGRNPQVVGIEDGDLDSAILDRRAPIGSFYVAIGRRAWVAGEIVDGLFETAAA